MKNPHNGNAPINDCQAIDPDPMSIFMGVVGFLGSVASIASYAEFRKSKNDARREQQTKILREARDLLMSLEADIMQVETSLRKLEFILLEGTTEHRSLPLAKLKLEFGSCKPLFTWYGFQKYEEIMKELNRLVGKSFDSVSNLLQRLYNLDIEISDEVHLGLIDLQKRLNKILRKDCTYEEGFREYYEVIVWTKNITRDIRNILNDSINKGY